MELCAQGNCLAVAGFGLLVPGKDKIFYTIVCLKVCGNSLGNNHMLVVCDDENI